MKVGIKLWSSNPQKAVDEAAFADFIEVLPVDLASVSKFAAKSYEYVIHAPHEAFGFNPLLKERKSSELLQLAISAAKKLRTKTILMHSGYLKEELNSEKANAAIKKTAKFVNSVEGYRVLIENSIYLGATRHEKGNHYICYDYKQLNQLLEITKAGFCLDFEHAAVTAYQLGVEYEEHVKSLMKLRPDYFHLSGVELATYRHHLSIFEGDIAINFVKQLLKKADKPVCLETPIDVEQRKSEVEFLKNV